MIYKINLAASAFITLLCLFAENWMATIGWTCACIWLFILVLKK